MSRQVEELLAQIVAEWDASEGRSVSPLTIDKARDLADEAQVQAKLDGVDDDPPMTNDRAVALAEGLERAEPGELLIAWQYLIDTGLAWRLQGWFGRAAKAMIDQGYCTPPKEG